MNISQKEIKQLQIQERKLARQKYAEKERSRKLKAVEAQIKRWEPEYKTLKQKLDRAYQRRAKLAEVEEILKKTKSGIEKNINISNRTEKKDFLKSSL